MLPSDHPYCGLGGSGVKLRLSAAPVEDDDAPEQAAALTLSLNPNTKPDPQPQPLTPTPNPGNIEQLTKKDALSLEHLATMNAAFCGFYGNISCPSTPARCGGVKGKPFLQEVRRARTVIERCADDHEGWWVQLPCKRIWRARHFLDIC